MLRWKSSLKPAAATSGLSNPTLLGKRDPTSTEQTTTQIDISSATQGALMIASVTARSTQANLSGPSESGWTLLASVDNGNATNRPLNRAYYKVAGASESTVTWTHDSDYTSAVAIEIVGADETSIYDYATNGVDLYSGNKDILLPVNVPNNGFAIAIHAKGDDADTSSSTVRDTDDNTQTQYTMLGDAHGATRSGTAIAWGDVGSGDTNGTDKIVGSGSGSRTATHHIAIRVPVTGLIAFEDSAYNDGHSGYSSPRNMTANYPAVSTNDIMLMFVVTDSTNTGDLGTKDGWTKVAENDYRNTIGAYWKLATSNASATSETWDNMFGSNEHYYVWVGAYSGCNTTSPIDVSTTTTQTSNGTNWSTSISPLTNNTMVVTCFAHDKTNSTGAFSNGSDRAASYFESDDINGYALINDKIVGATGSTERSAIFTNNVRGPEVAIALKPA